MTPSNSRTGALECCPDWEATEPQRSQTVSIAEEYANANGEYMARNKHPEGSNPIDAGDIGGLLPGIECNKLLSG